ncbi:hypothetical protein [Staphylococcus gallinarum]|uniref:hypothetical protein n=1 Tax=Staphylococcus gallinarum TaxID=1293 RepID=UPI001E604B2B|nr:hypothetical protein [Staphylococcus gallinarum]MCD8845209.1 hypothetical protein [Staphylococcus gallinarum]
MNERAGIFVKVGEFYYGIYVMKHGNIESLGKILVDYYDYDKALKLVNEKFSLSELKGTIKESIDNRLCDYNEHFIACMHEDALKHRHCFSYNTHGQLRGVGKDWSFVPYTEIEVDYIYLLSKTFGNDWLVSYEGSHFDFESVQGNLELYE